MASFGTPSRMRGEQAVVSFGTPPHCRGQWAVVSLGTPPHRQCGGYSREFVHKVKPLSSPCAVDSGILQYTTTMQGGAGSGILQYTLESIMAGGGGLSICGGHSKSACPREAPIAMRENECFSRIFWIFFSACALLKTAAASAVQAIPTKQGSGGQGGSTSINI